MALPIEDYALIGDTQTVALVGKDGSIDWMCVPRFDSGACFSALLGGPEHGRWQIAPKGRPTNVRRRYRPGTLILETEFTTSEGTVRLVDCMPPRERTPDVVRLVEGVSGRVPMQMELIIRFDYGSIVPWVRREPDGALSAIAGPDALALYTPVRVRGKGLTSVTEFTVSKGERVPFHLCWHPSCERRPPALAPIDAIPDTEQWWKSWSSRCLFCESPWREAVTASQVVLKALTYAPTGGIVAAATTSLPEWPGGVRNWDYRYCWLRDATFTLYSLMMSGYLEEAAAWRDWLLRSVAGDAAKLQIMYGVAGERRLTEYEIPWLAGYLDARPVRVGNAAVKQLQLDVYGEVMDALFQARRGGIPPEEAAWDLQRALLDFLEGNWMHPDEGLWEVRGGRRHFTHSQIMAWVAFDRAVRTVEEAGAAGPVERWRALRDEIHAQVLQRGWSEGKKSFTQAYGSERLDASLLLIPQVGFLPATDPRFIGTVAAVERELLHDGFVRRYALEGQDEVDGLPPGEGAFLACSFWLADAYALTGRTGDARRLFEKLLALRNDVGLLSEEYDPEGKRLLGNFPQAFSHVGLVNTAFNLSPEVRSPCDERARK